MRLGDKVRFKKALTSSRWCTDWDKEESIKFAKENNVAVHESSEYVNGVFIGSKWRVRKFEDVQEGMLCGVRNVDINGIFNWEDGYSFSDRKKVYLIATNLKGFWRVPEEFIVTD